MRLNKKKLAALAMSAVMAASTMPFPVLAEEFTDGDVVAVETYAGSNDAAVEFGVASVVIAQDGKVTVNYTDGTSDTTTYTATIETKAATCKADKQTIGTVVVEGKTYRKVWTEENTKLPHNVANSEMMYTVDKYPSCTENETGLAHYYKICSACGEEVKQGSDVILPVTDAHTKGEVVTTYENKGNVEISDDGKTIIGLIDKKADGKYVEVVTTYCASCKTPINVEKSDEKVLWATEMPVTSRKVVYDPEGNIKYDSSSETDPSKIVDAKLQLKDCTKDGFYWIVSYNGSEVLSKVAHTVSAHHVTTTVYLAKDTKNQGKLANVTDKDGNVIGVKNLTCKEDIEYYEVEKCIAESNKEISRSEVKVAKASEDHTLNTTGKTKVKAAVDEVKTNGILSKATYNDLKNNEKSYGIKVVTTGDCEEEGTVTITSYCTICGKEADSVTLKVAKREHIWDDPVEENRVEATCTETGSFDTVKYCKVCGKKEVVRKGVVLPKKDHSFVGANGIDYTNAYIKFTGTKVVDDAPLNVKGSSYVPNAKYGMFSVSAAAVIDCENCGKAVEVSNTTNDTVAIKVVDLEKETAEKAGSITLKATWTKTSGGKTTNIEKTSTFPYFSSVVAYFANPDKDPANGLTLDKDNTFRYYENGVFKSDFNGIADYNGAKFFVKDGILASDLNHVQLSPDGKDFYYLTSGRITTEYTGLNPYDGEFFYVVNGKIDLTKNGIVEYNGKKFLVAVGRKVKEANGLWPDPDGTWYFLANGEVQDQYTGTTTYDGKTFTLENGKLVG